MLAKRWLYPLTFLAFAPVLCATPPAPTPPAEPDVVLPDAPPVTPPAPTPQPAPAITKLSAAELYPIESKVPLLVLASPEGIVTITEETGPIRVRAIFAGNTRYSTRQIKGPSVYFVEAAATGRVELLIARKDGTGKVIRRTLDVTNGPAPIPPTPDPDPTPKPPGPVDPLKTFRVILIFESADNLTPAQRGIVYGKAVEDYLIANCTGGRAGFRRRDKDAPGENDPTMAALWAAVQPAVTVTPCIALERNGKVEIVNLPKTPAETIEMMKRYKEGK